MIAVVAPAGVRSAAATDAQLLQTLDVPEVL